MSDSLFRLWMATVERAPSATAVTDFEPRRDWTRAALSEAAASLSDSFPMLRGRPALAGHRVAMSVSNGADWFAVFLALLRSGAAPVPIDPSEPEAAQAAAAASAGASHLWQAGTLHSLGRRAKAARPGERASAS
jgi:acyl-CoA synthetase (AMP-forming)/AMP-acid ligase II